MRSAKNIDRASLEGEPARDFEGVLPRYADGFSKRSGIRVSVNLQPSVGRFTREIQLTLLRVVQEPWTNIHLHSGSPAGEIAVSKDAPEVKTNVIRIEVCRLGQRKTRKKKVRVSFEGSPNAVGRKVPIIPKSFAVAQRRCLILAAV